MITSSMVPVLARDHVLLFLVRDTEERERERVVSRFNQYHDYIINGPCISLRPCVTIFSKRYRRERERESSF